MGDSPSCTDAENKVFYVDLSGLSSPDEVQARFYRELPMPDHYGFNLDALYDVLTERGAGWNIIVYGTRGIMTGKPRYLATLKRLCHEACEETPGLKIRFYENR